MEALTVKTTKGVQTLNIENNSIESIVNVTHNTTTDHIIDALLALPPVNITMYKNNLNISLQQETHSIQTPNITITPPTDSSQCLYATDLEDLMADDFLSATPSTSTATTSSKTRSQFKPGKISLMKQTGSLKYSKV